LPISRLTRLQRDVLREFFSREQRFFLTGGAALAGYYLGHRETDDLDLFTTADILNEGGRVLTIVAEVLGGRLETTVDTPLYKQYFIYAGTERLKIELVRDEHQLLPKLVVNDLIHLDAKEEIAANKLTTLLSRGEIRDLVDLRELEASGIDLEEALGRAHQKDRGATPGQLVEVLSEIRIGDDADIPDGTQPAKLRTYLEDLIARLVRLAYPRQ
jgi:predicted nucleotidyltransferase component of viral defense system